MKNGKCKKKKKKFIEKGEREREKGFSLSLALSAAGSGAFLGVIVDVGVGHQMAKQPQTVFVFVFVIVNVVVVSRADSGGERTDRTTTTPMNDIDAFRTEVSGFVVASFRRYADSTGTEAAFYAFMNWLNKSF